MRYLFFLSFLALSLSAPSGDVCDPSKVSNLTGHQPSLFSESEHDTLVEIAKKHFGEETIKAALENPDGEEMHRITTFVQQRVASTIDRRISTGSLVGSLIYFMTPLRHTFVPHRQLLRRGNLRIVGRRSTSLETIDGVANTIEGFDGRARTWGLRIPELTKIVLFERTKLPRLGSSLPPTPVFDIPRGRLARSIELTPAFHDKTSAYLDPWTLMHERAHSLLLSNFKRRSYVNTDKVVMEALADFLAAHASGNPRGPYRHIKEMIDEYGSPIDLGSIGSRGYHNQSIVFSHLLWNLRERTGERGMSEIIVPFIGGLNSNSNGRLSQDLTPSLRKLLGEEFFVSEFEYFAAVLLKTAREKGHGDSAASAIRESARKLSINESDIFSQSKEFDGTDTMWTENLVTFRDASYGYSMTLLPWAWCAGIIYIIVQPLIWLLS